MYMGESDSTDRNPSKPVCDRILGFRTGEVKEKTTGLLTPFKRCIPNGLGRKPAFVRLWKSCGKAFEEAPISRLTAGNLGAYSLPRVVCSRPSGIIAPGSSLCHMFRDRIR